MSPTVSDVFAFLGRPVDTDQLEHVGAHLSTVTAMVSAYTRGQGFDPLTGEPGEDLAAVVISACARSVGNPSHTITETLGSYDVRYGTFAGWTLPELAILHTYRRRTA